MTNYKQLLRGDIVTPKTPAGLWLASTPVNGDYYQERSEVCVFTGTGKVLERHVATINYDEWAEQDKINGLEVFCGLGKVEYVSLLVECDCGTGWAGQGAVDVVK
jgi:hypothetical protein